MRAGSRPSRAVRSLAPLEAKSNYRGSFEIASLSS
ncbi:hypothetical protein SAMN05216525_13197 [Bradyrhizobium sp. Gha]|nr:hypothetical protein SAMN05216525_13197 [Bradyrhizobium sp. Gha]